MGKAADALRSVLERGAITPVFQPVWTVAGELWGFEALSRFPNGANPEDVWGMAQQRNLAPELDRVALRHAVDAAAALPGALFLNVSACHFREWMWLAQLPTAERIIFEVTERAALCPQGREGVHQLQDLGYRIAMDDAGALHATLDRLDRIRPDIVKIDHPIINDWSLGNTELLKRWVGASHAIGAIVLAEGVENSAWVDELGHYGIQAFQGFALGRPAPAEFWRECGVESLSLGPRRAPTMGG